MQDSSNSPLLLSYNSDFINTTEAINMLEGNAPAAESQPPTPPDGQQVPAAAAPVSEQLYEVKINGQTHKVPLSELTSGYSRQQDYTRKTTELSEQRRLIDAEVSQYKQQIQEVQQFFQDPRVRQALAQLQAGVQDPNQPVTAQQAQQLIQAQSQQNEQSFEQRMQAAMQELEVKTLANNYGREIDNTLASLTQKFPVLADIDGFEQALRFKVSLHKPQSLDEAKQLFNDIASGVAAKIEGRIQTQQKQAAVEQAKVIKGGIEPPGGAALPLPNETKFKLGSADLVQAAISDMLGQSK